MRDDELFRLLLQLLRQLVEKMDRLLDSQARPALPSGQWLSTKAAARVLGRNRVTLQRWCSKHMKAKLPGVRYDPRHVGICYEIHESLVEEWRGRDEGGNGNAEREAS